MHMRKAVVSLSCLTVIAAVLGGMHGEQPAADVDHRATPPAAGAGYGDFVGIEITQPDFSNGYVLHDGSVVPETTDAVGEAWETFRQAWTVYRVWITVTTEGSIVRGVNGSPDNAIALVLDPGDCGFFNSALSSDGPPNPQAMTVIPDLAFDSWVTIGSAEFVTDLTITDLEDDFQGLAGAVECQHCSWVRLFPPADIVVPSGHDYYRVLLAQLTVPRGKTFEYALRPYMNGGYGYFEHTADFDWTCVDQCPWDTTPPGGNAVVNIDDLIEVVQHVGSTADRYDIAPDHGNGAYGDFIVDTDDLLAVIDNFGACP